MKRLHLVGKKNSGKTTLVVELVEHFTATGYRVGTIKHTHHRHELDTPGKDSHRHRQAGAAVVGIMSPELNAMFWKPADDADANNPYDQLDAVFQECDFVLVEGHYQTTGPKVEIWRSAVAEAPLAHADRSILAVITDDPVEVGVPIWPRSDIATLADAVLQHVTASS